MLMQFSELLSVGHEIQLYGAIYSGRGQVYLVPLPDEDPNDLPRLRARRVAKQRSR